MSNGPPLPGSSEEKSELAHHRDFVQAMGKIISGEAAYEKTDQVIRVYRIPNPKALKANPAAREVQYGRIDWDDSGYYEERSARRIIDAGEPHEKVAFLSSLRHSIETERRQLAAQANKNYEQSRTSRTAATPPGPMGHWLREYDQLLDQIEHEHYRQRDRRQDG